MNYNSIQDIITAGITNATVLVNNSKHDDDAVSISNVPSWIKYNGIVPTVIYASGNSWFGINSQTEHIKFNRRDTAMWYLYAEEGLLYNYYSFYRLRWRGYSYYGQTSGSCLQEWEIIFFSTGDILLYTINIPTSYTDGVNQLTAGATYNYTRPTNDNPYVTFYTQDANNSTFLVEYSLINIPLPYDRKYLLKDGSNKYYTVVNGALEEITVTTLTAQVFKDYGVDTKPTSALLCSLVDPTVLYWQDSSDPLPTKWVAASAVPPAQIVYSANVGFETAEIEGIRNVLINGSNDVIIAMSDDNGVSWLKHNGSSWISVSGDYDGMSVSAIQALTTADFVRFSTNRQWKMRFILYENSYINSIKVNYNQIS